MNSTPRPKSLAALFLFGAFLTGGAVGYAVTRTFGGPISTPAQFTQMQLQAQMRERWKQDLGLRPDQVVQFDALYDARRVQRDSIRALYTPAVDSIIAPYVPALESLRVSNQQKVMQILDSTQKTKYQKMIDADKRNTDSLKKAGVVK
ncbi:MAG: hypothetical protein ABJB74_21430 [Gemmatimonas sp.]